MRVGLVRIVGLSAVAFLTVGLAGCDDNPLDFDPLVAIEITANPISMTIVSEGETTLLESRTVGQGGEPTWDDIDWSLDPTCGVAQPSLAVAATNLPEIDPPGLFDVTGGTTVGMTCITLEGGGVSNSVEVTVVGASLSVVAAPDTIVFEGTTQLTATLLGAAGAVLNNFDQLTDIVWSATPGVTVDATGFVTWDGVGTSIVTATWALNQITVSGSIPIVTLAPATPILASISAASGDHGTVLTLTGTFTSATRAFVDGVENPFSLAISPTEVTFVMPMNAAAVGAHVITAGTQNTTDESVVSLPYTVLAGFTNGSSEPNESLGTAGVQTFPFFLNDGISAADPDDLWLVNFAADATVTVIVDWDDVGTDVDFFILDAAGSATCISFYDKPEGTTCDSGGDGSVVAGDVFFNVNYFSGPDAVYSIVVK